MRNLLKGLGKILRAALLILLAAGGWWGSAVLRDGWLLYDQAVRAESLPDKVAEVRRRDRYTPLDQLPETYVQAVIAVEDHRYYSHGALDVIAILRAAWYDLKTWSFAQGGSTITQQLACSLYFNKDKVFPRKVAELLVAVDLEEAYDKDEILELYTNAVYFGEGCYTVNEACQRYFGCDIRQATDYQCVVLAGIPNAPSVYAYSVNPELADQRARQVLAAMVRCGYLSEEEAQAILDQAPAPTTGCSQRGARAVKKPLFLLSPRG
jgi:membrane peptidoglycan carboxypeptidase